MTGSSQASPTIVLDASLAINLVLDTPHTKQTANLFESWALEGRRLIAPALWAYEVTSALHKIQFLAGVSDQIASQALQAILDLGIEMFEPDNETCSRAYVWATRLKQASAYDGFYLALAEMTGAEFWTADRRIARAARQSGAGWVHWIGKE